MDADANKSEPKAQADPKAIQQDSPQGAPQALQFKRDEDFESLYANNVRFESSVWDLKLIFGQLDQSTGQEVIELHTAMTIPWTTAKLMLYYLQLNIVVHELENGKIRINPRVYPMMPPPLTPEFDNNELAKAAHELAVKMRAEFISDQQ
jgi:hypothetical protein